MKTEAKTETVVGEPFELGAFKCVPVIKVGMGFGSGGGEGTEAKTRRGEGLGAGAGMGIEPIGFLVTKGEEISFPVPSSCVGHDRRLASQISHDRCSITIGERRQKTGAPIHFPGLFVHSPAKLVTNKRNLQTIA